MVKELNIGPGDALIVVDLQNDFLPGGALGVPEGDEVVPVLNRYIEAFDKAGLPVFATRDWHPPGHCSFEEQGGPWPPHCLAESEGARFAPSLELPKDAVVISKAKDRDFEAYSGFQGTDLADRLRGLGVRRLFIGGLATDYCVKDTVIDALDEGFEVRLLRDTIRAVDVEPGDGEQAERLMTNRGALPTYLEDLWA